MHIRRFTTLDELVPYADDWDRLAAGVPFCGSTWLWHWWRHYGLQNDADRSRRRLAVLGVFNDADVLMGVAPWYVDSSVVHGRVLRPLGSGEVCSDYLSVLCHPARKDAIVDALAEYLVRSALDDAPGALHWDLLELDGVGADDHVMASLLDNLGLLGCTLHRRPGLSCWRLELPTEWDCYVASLAKRQRRTVRHLEKEVIHTDRVVLHTPARLDELPEAMDILVDLHQRRRQSLGEPGCFASPPFLGFYRDVVPELLRRGQVQLYWLELDGKPAAAEYHLQGDGVLYVYQAGVNPELLEQSPGNVINLMILRQAIERGFRGYDFLRGDEGYKARFGAHPRPTFGWRVVPPRAAAQVRHNLWLAGSNVKQWLKKRVRQGPPAAKEAIT
jgi:CelD/BcsL family acetyltransferase involved in cellulose biosynthesis